MKLIDGKHVSTEIKQNIKVEVDNIIKMVVDNRILLRFL